VAPPAPLDVCGAQSQGMIGYLFQQELQRLTGCPAVSLVTQVVVDPADPAFLNPSKPVGPFYTPDKALRHQEEQGWAMKEDAGRGWRRVVPSPLPRKVVEVEAVRKLVEAGALVIACGGGGVPVAEAAGALSGVEAVIDKDQTAAVLARELGADLLVILTDVEAAAVDYGKSSQRALGAVTVAELEALAAEGHFKSGSMRPKVEAALRFVRGGGERAAIASLARAAEAVLGTAGTQVTV
ncbi:MAG TPA: carbamate kinase, partial [Symbiobacteriaceae bacterium]|nr:carbamate kinase [Symbiobacteriaceae bacterium]